MTKLPLATSIEIPYSYPFWFFGKGTGMRLTSLDLKKKTVKISWGATLRISFNEHLSKPKKSWWTMKWEIEGPIDVKGETTCDADELLGAFDLNSYLEIRSSWGDWALKKYEADSISIGTYIRKGDFLNIPGPGIGRGADANISLRLNEKMKAGVLLLILEVEKERGSLPELKNLLFQETINLLEKYPDKESLFKQED
jgi:hypothetical protein